MRIWIVLPAYNEALNLPAIFQNLTRVAEETYRLDIRIIVIDDGSTDDTARIALSGAYPLKVELLQNEVNMGLAVTFMRGMKAVCERASREDIIFCMDADNSHLPGQIPSMIQGIADGRDVVIGRAPLYAEFRFSG